MHKFEQYLISKGYTKHEWDYSIKPTPILLETIRDNYSSMGTLHYIYKKPGSDKSCNCDTDIRFGLCQKGYPPTLSYPRPIIRIKTLLPENISKDCFTINWQENKIVSGWGEDPIWLNEDFDFSMEYVFGHESCEKIYEAITNFQNNIYKFIYDLTINDSID